MRISSISTLWTNNSINNINNNKKKYVQYPFFNKTANDVFVKSSQPFAAHKRINFMGYPVYIVDGGNQATDMQHFATAASKDIELHMRRAEDAPNNEYNLNKPLKNIETQLRRLNDYGLTDENSYVAVPIIIPVSLENLAEQYKRVMGNYIHLKPHTTQSSKEKLLTFLERLYSEPDKYRKYIEYMDPENLGLEYAYGIIQEINKLKCKKVYVPAGYPQEETLNWLAGERGEKPELTNYLATGYDEDNKVHNMLNYIKDQGWYDFNLLALSKADVVNLKKMDGYSDHIYSSYDTTVNDGARGVFNLYPIRENGQIKGYSFNDTVTNEYPVEEFPYNDEVKDIAKFVGLSVDEAVADDAETYRFKQAMHENRIDESFSGKLYPVWKLFDENELREKKIFAKGDFVDYKLQNFFRRNRDYKIIYPKGDCENSGRPSVKAMWGSSYSILSAIKRDIDKRRIKDNLKAYNNLDLNSAILNLLSNASDQRNIGNLNDAVKHLSKAVEYIDMDGFNPNNSMHMNAYKDLADLKFELGNYDEANGLYNFYLNNVCKNYRLSFSESDKDKYINEIKRLFHRLAQVARKRGEEDNAKICERAAYEVGYSRLGEYVIKRRADNDVNIGDIFV